MRTFIAACMLLILLFACVCLNSHYVVNTIEGYRTIIEEQTRATEGTGLYQQFTILTELWQRWSKDVRLLSLTVNHADLMVVEEKFSAVIGAASADAYEDYMVARQQLLYSLAHLKEMGEVNLGNVF